MLRLSIVIPASHEQNALETTLLSVLENRPSSCEVLVVCSPDYSDEYDLQDEVRFIRSTNRSQCWHQMANVGVAECTGEVVHLLQPGLVVSDGWTDAALELLDYEHDVAAVSPLVFDDNGAAPLTGVVVGRGGKRVEVRQGKASHDQPGFAPSEIAGFYRRASLTAVGGWDARIVPELANIELGCALTMQGERCKVARLSQVHSANQQLPRSSAFTVARSHEILARRYQGVSDKRLTSSAVVSALSFMPNSLQYFLGRMAGRFTSIRRPKAISGEPLVAIHPTSRAA